MKIKKLGLLLTAIAILITGLLVFVAAPVMAANAAHHDANCPYTICNSGETTFSDYDFYSDHVVAHFPSGDVTFNLVTPQKLGGEIKFKATGGKFCSAGVNGTDAYLLFHYQSDNDLHANANINTYNIQTKTCNAAENIKSDFIRPEHIFDRTGKDPCPAQNNPSGCSGPPAVAGTGSGTGTNTRSIQSAQLQQSVQQNPIFKDLQDIINFLSGAVGIVVVATIILGGIQYTAAGDKPEALGAAKKRIGGGIGALLMFFLMYAFLQWLIPGGIFSR